DVTGKIVALSVEGTSGFINHIVESDDPQYDGIFADGVSLFVANGTAGTVNVAQSGGNTVVYEPGPGQPPVINDTYTLNMAVPAPATPTLACLTVAAAPDPWKYKIQGGGSVQVSTDGVTYFDHLVLVFDSQAAMGSPNYWSRTQTIYVRAVD